MHVGRTMALLALAGALTAIVAHAAPGGAGSDRGNGNLVFPDDAGVIDLKAEFGAKGDGRTDDTRAIQAALDKYANGNRILYLPPGTYLISDTLKWGAGTHGGAAQKRTTLQGAGMDRTTVKLKDRCPGFQEPTATKDRRGRRREEFKAMIWTGRKPAQRFRNGIRHLTIDTGRGNPAATGVQYIANNQGSMRYVRIRSGDPDGAGSIGLDLGYTDEQGPCLIKHVHVIGFDVGIRTRTAVDSVTLEHITVEGQRRVGFSNDGQCVSMRDFVSRNAVPAIENLGSYSLMTVIEGELVGAGRAAKLAAVENSGALLVRNVDVQGYEKGVHNAAEGGTGEGAAAGRIEEFCSHRPTVLFEDSPRHTLGLPVKETPVVPSVPLSEWVSPAEFGGNPEDDEDDTEAVQKAVDSGRRVLYFPRGRKWLVDGTVEIRGSIERVTSLEGSIFGTGTLKVTAGTPRTVIFDRMGQTYKKVAIENASDRTMVLSGVLTWGDVRLTGPGDCFLEDYCGRLEMKGQNVWARQWNNEAKSQPKFLNDGGTVWILGLKTEQAGTLIETVRGGRTEVLGGFCYAQGAPKTTPMFILTNAAGSFTIGEITFNNRPFKTIVRETRGGETRELIRREPGTYVRGPGTMLPLFVGYGK